MPSPEQSRLPLWEAAALVLAGLLALAFHFRLPGQLPEESDYQALAKELDEQAAPGDVLFLHPWWAERARLFAPERLPVVGYLGSEADPLTPYRRIWLLSQPRLPGANRAGLERAFLPGRSRLSETRRLGKLELTLYRNGLHRPLLFSAAESFASARVYLEGPQGRQDCFFDGRVHRCPNGQQVAQEWHELKFQPRRCLWFKPPGGETRLVAEFPRVVTGELLSLEGGVIWEHAFRHEPSLSTVRVGAEQGMEIAIPPGFEGVKRAEAMGANFPAELPLKLWVQADNPEGRETCVDFFSYGPLEAPTEVR